MQTTQQIQKVSCVVCNTKTDNQKTKLETASNLVARTYCSQPTFQKSPLTKSYNFRYVFG